MLEIRSDATWEQTVTITGAGSLRLPAGTHTFTDATVSGDVNLTTGTLAIPSLTTTTFEDTLTYDNNGVLNVPGRLVIGGTLDMDTANSVNLNVNGSTTGTLEIPVGSTLDIGGAGTGQRRFVDITVENSGTVTVTNDRVDIVGDQSFENLSGGLLNIAGDFQLHFADTGTDAALNNYCTVRKSAGAAQIENTNGGTGSFNNLDGTIDIDSGVLEIGSDANYSGTTSVIGAGTLKFPAGTHTFSAGSVVAGDINLTTGTLTVPVDASLQFDGTLTYDNNGVLNVPGLLVIGGTLDMDTANSVNLNINGSTTGMLEIPAGSTLEIGGPGTGGRQFLDITVANSGTITITRDDIDIVGDQPFGNHAGALFDIAGDFQVQFANTGTDAVFSNLGTVHKSAGAGAAQIENDNGGTGSFDNVGGIIDIDSGTLEIRSDANYSGTTSVTGAGTLRLPAGTHTLTDGSRFSGDVNLTNGTLTVAAGTSATLDGTLTYDSNGVLTVAGHLALDGALDMDTANNVNLNANGSTTGTLEILAGSTLDFGGAGGGSRQFLDITVLNSGTVTITNNNVDIIGDQPFENLAGGLIDIAGDFQLQFRDTGTDAALNNYGTVRKSTGAGTAQIENTNGGTGSFNPEFGGLVEVDAGTLQVEVNVTNRGTIDVASGTEFTVTAATFENDVLGILQGSGTIDPSGTLDNSGTIAPGASPGFLTIDGNLVADELSRIDIELAGSISPGTDYDHLAVTGTVTLDGSLNVTEESGFFASSGDQFSVLTASSVTGDFGIVNESFRDTYTLPIELSDEVLLDVTATNSLILWGGGSGLWETGSNWIGGIAPGANDDASIPTEGITVTVSAALQAARGLNANDNALFIASTGDLTLDGSSFIDASLDINGGTLSITDSLLLNTGNTATVDTSGTLGGGGIFDNDGTLDFSGGTLGLLADNASPVQFTGGTNTVNAGAGITGGTVNFSGASTATTFASGSVYEGAITNISDGTVTFDITADLGALTLSGGTLAGTTDLTLSAASTWSGGTIEGTVTEKLVVNGGLAISGAGSKTLRDRILENSEGSTITWSDSGNIVTETAGSGLTAINNLSGATFDIQSDADVQFNGDFLVITNDGLWQRTAGGGTSRMDARFNNDGTVQVDTGRLRLEEGFHTGDFTVASGATLEFGDNDHTFNSGASVSGAGTTDFTVTIGSDVALFNAGSTITTPVTITSGGEVTFDAAQVLPSLVVSDGTLSGSADVTLTGASIWSGGTIEGTATEKLIVNGGLTISNAAAVTLRDRILENSNGSTITWTGAGNIRTATAGAGLTAITNPAGATVDIQTDADIEFNGDFLTITNEGLWQRTSGSGTSRLDAHFDNDGTVQVDTGRLRLGEGVHSGSFTVAAGAVLEFGQFDHTFNSGASLSGQGTVDFAVTSGSDVAVFNTGSNYNADNTDINGDVNFNISATTDTLTHASDILGGTGSLTVNTSWTPTSGVTLDGNLITDASIDKSFTGFTLNGSGTLTMGGNLALSGGTPNTFSPDVEVNDLTISDFSTVLTLNGTNSITGAMNWTNGSTLGGAGTTTVDGGINFSGSNNWTVNGGHTSIADSDVTFTASRDLLINNGSELQVLNTRTLDFQADSDISDSAGTGTLTLDAGSLLEKTVASGTSQLDVTTLNSGGDISIQTGTLQVTPNFSNNGTLTIAAGTTLDLNGTTNANASGAIIQGNGTLDAGASPFTNSGTIRAGTSPGLLNVTGALIFASGSSLDVEIAGSGATVAGTGGTDYDLVAATGSVTINSGAILNVTDPGPYTGNTIDMLTVLTGSSVTGTFDTVNQATNFSITQNNTGTGLRLDVSSLFNTWTGVTDLTWDDPSNWSRNQIPQTDHSTFINVGGITVTHSTGTDSVNDLTLIGSSTLAITNGSLTVSNASTIAGSLSLTGGTFKLDGTTNSIGGNLTIQNNATVLDLAGDTTVSGQLDFQGGTITGASTTHADGGILVNTSNTKVLSGGHTLENNGTLTMSAGNLRVNDGATLHNLAGSLIDFNSNADINNTSGTGTLDNDGTIRKSAGTLQSNLILSIIDNDGDIDVQSGTLLIQSTTSQTHDASTMTVSNTGSQLKLDADAGTATHTGTSVTANADTELRVEGGNTTFDATSTISGTGDVTFAPDTGDTLDYNGAFPFSGDVLLAGNGTTDLSANVSLASLEVASGTLNIEGIGANTIAGSLTVKNLATVLDLAGDTTVSGQLDFQGGTITGASTTRADGGILVSTSTTKVLSGGHTLENNGTLTMSVGDLRVNDGATLHNLAGSLIDFTNDSDDIDNSSGTGTLDNEGTIRKSGGSGQSLLGVSIIDNDGTIDVQSGTLRVTPDFANNGTVFIASGATLDLERNNQFQRRRCHHSRHRHPRCRRVGIYQFGNNPRRNIAWSVEHHRSADLCQRQLARYRDCRYRRHDRRRRRHRF